MNKNIFAVLALSILINNAPASAAETQKLPAPLISDGKPLMETLAARRKSCYYSNHRLTQIRLLQIPGTISGI